MDLFRVLINERPSVLCLIDQNSGEVHNLQDPDEEEKILVLLSASVKRFGGSRMQDFLSRVWGIIGKLTVFGSDGGSRWDWFCGGRKVGELCGSLAKYLFEAWWDENGIRWDWSHLTSDVIRLPTLSTSIESHFHSNPPTRNYIHKRSYPVQTKRYQSIWLFFSGLLPSWISYTDPTLNIFSYFRISGNNSKMSSKDLLSSYINIFNAINH